MANIALGSREVGAGAAKALLAISAEAATINRFNRTVMQIVAGRRIEPPARARGKNARGNQLVTKVPQHIERKGEQAERDQTWQRQWHQHDDNEHRERFEQRLQRMERQRRQRRRIRRQMMDPMHGRINPRHMDQPVHPIKVEIVHQQRHGHERRRNQPLS
ncbi:MAG: hypothetical protein K8S25_14075 [Alphaproteobacteria bacterium]|nr:hypothetical protein [Alphaproteobacteria bacterium]